MPAKSKSQQRLMGMVHAYQKGELKKNDVKSDDLWEKIKKMAKSMKKKDAKDFAETKHKGLPETKESKILRFDNFLNEDYIDTKPITSKNPLNKLRENITISVRDIDGYVEYLSDEIKNMSNVDNLEDYDVYELDSELAEEYYNMKDFLDDLLNYGSYDSSIVTDEIIRDEAESFIDEELDRLNIPSYIVVNKESSISNYKNDYDIIEYKGKNGLETFYLRN